MQDGGGGKVARGVIQRLDRQRSVLALLEKVHTGVGYSAAHLHQTVETPSIAPWACPSVSVQADVHDPRPNLLADFGAQTHSLQRIGAVAMQNHIGFGHERLQSPELGGYAQVQY